MIYVKNGDIRKLDMWKVYEGYTEGGTFVHRANQNRVDALHIYASIREQDSVYKYLEDL